MLLNILSMFTAALAIGKKYEVSNPETEDKVARNSVLIQAEAANEIPSLDSDEDEKNTGCFCWPRKPKSKRKSSIGSPNFKMSMQHIDLDLNESEKLQNGEEKAVSANNEVHAGPSTSPDASQANERLYPTLSRFADQ